MKLKLFLIINCLLINFCIAQVQLKILTSENGEDKFPYLLLNNKKAQDNNNTYLHAKYLKVVPDTSKNPFRKTSTGSLYYLNYAYFEDVNLITSKYPLTTVSFFTEFCGAYCEGSTNYFSFDLNNGNLITSSDLIDPNKTDLLANKLNKTVEKQVKDFIKTIPKPNSNKDSDDNELYNEQLSIYENCLEYINFYDLKSYEMFIENDSIIFNRGRCSNHASRAADDLGQFRIGLSTKEISPFYLRMVKIY